MPRKGREEKKDMGDSSSSSQRSTRSRSRAEAAAAGSQPAEVSELFHPMTSFRFNLYTIQHTKHMFCPLIRFLFKCTLLEMPITEISI